MTIPEKTLPALNCNSSLGKRSCNKVSLIFLANLSGCSFASLYSHRLWSTTMKKFGSGSV